MSFDVVDRLIGGGRRSENVDNEAGLDVVVFAAAAGEALDCVDDETLNLDILVGAGAAGDAEAPVGAGDDEGCEVGESCSPLGVVEVVAASGDDTAAVESSVDPSFNGLAVTET